MNELINIYKAIVWKDVIIDKCNGSFIVIPKSWESYNPVLIWDVLHFVYNVTNAKELIWLWKHKKRPIEDQPIECIGYVYKIITDYKLWDVKDAEK